MGKGHPDWPEYLTACTRRAPQAAHGGSCGGQAYDFAWEIALPDRLTSPVRMFKSAWSRDTGKAEAMRRDGTGRCSRPRREQQPRPGSADRGRGDAPRPAARAADRARPETRTLRCVCSTPAIRPTSSGPLPSRIDAHRAANRAWAAWRHRWGFSGPSLTSRNINDKTARMTPNGGAPAVLAFPALSSSVMAS